MNIFNLRVKTSSMEELEETIGVWVDRETFLLVKKTIRNMLKARDYL